MTQIRMSLYSSWTSSNVLLQEREIIGYRVAPVHDHSPPDTPSDRSLFVEREIDVGYSLHELVDLLDLDLSFREHFRCLRVSTADEISVLADPDEFLGDFGRCSYVVDRARGASSLRHSSELG